MLGERLLPTARAARLPLRIDLRNLHPLRHRAEFHPVLIRRHDHATPTTNTTEATCSTNYSPTLP